MVTLAIHHHETKIESTVARPVVYWLPIYEHYTTVMIPDRLIIIGRETLYLPRSATNLHVGSCGTEPELAMVSKPCSTPDMQFVVDLGYAG
jgi:hypothetical protein